MAEREVIPHSQAGVRRLLEIADGAIVDAFTAGVASLDESVETIWYRDVVPVLAQVQMDRDRWNQNYYTMLFGVYTEERLRWLAENGLTRG